MNSTLIVDYLYDKGQCNLTYPGPKPKGKSGERRSENGSNDKRGRFEYIIRRFYSFFEHNCLN